MVRETKVIMADLKIDVKKLDEQLETHLCRVWNKQTVIGEEPRVRFPAAKEEWEIDSHKLVVKKFIARGTFGEVCRGVYNGKDVAVKVLDFGEESPDTKGKVASLMEDFMQEVSVWNKLDHPNVVKFVGTVKGTSELSIKSTRRGGIKLPSNGVCIVAEYIPGGTLRSYLMKKQLWKLSFKVVIRLALGLARGLSYLHSQKIVHRDVKPENVLLDKNLNCKITDFGVSRVEASKITEFGVFAVKTSNPTMSGGTGTLGYMAPEIFCNEAYDCKCDVYSLGICLWEIYCCSVVVPCLRLTEQTSDTAYKNLRPQIPKHCPSSLKEVMEQCWDVNPKKRPEMEDVVRMLEAIGTSKCGRLICRNYQQPGCFSSFFRHRATYPLII